MIDDSLYYTPQGGGGTGFFDIMSEFFFQQFSDPFPLSIYGIFGSRVYIFRRCNYHRPNF